ncbi:MAG: hypothetical protein ACKO96_21390, partial [Flammeovirgaceae bacterium]
MFVAMVNDLTRTYNGLLEAYNKPNTVQMYVSTTYFQRNIVLQMIEVFYQLINEFYLDFYNISLRERLKYQRLSSDLKHVDSLDKIKALKTEQFNNLMMLHFDEWTTNKASLVKKGEGFVYNGSAFAFVLFVKTLQKMGLSPS